MDARLSGRAAVHDAGHLHSRGGADLRGDIRRQRHLNPRDSEPRTDHPAGRDEGVDDLARGRVDRYGETDPDSGDRCIHADHATGTVGEHAAAVAGVQGGIRLDARATQNGREFAHGRARRAASAHPPRVARLGRRGCLEALHTMGTTRIVLGGRC